MHAVQAVLTAPGEAVPSASVEALAGVLVGSRLANPSVVEHVTVLPGPGRVAAVFFVTGPAAEAVGTVAAVVRRLLAGDLADQGWQLASCERWPAAADW